MLPFTTPGPIKSLAYLGGHTHLRCTAPGIPGISPGEVLPLAVLHEDTRWPETRISAEGDIHHLTLQGRELLIQLVAADGCKHHFHTRPEDATRHRPVGIQPAINPFRPRPLFVPAIHHPLAALLENFHIPTPPSVIDQDPARYQRHLDRLTQLEALINT